MNRDLSDKKMLGNQRQAEERACAKDSEVGKFLVCLRNTEEVRVAGVQ